MCLSLIYIKESQQNDLNSILVTQTIKGNMLFDIRQTDKTQITKIFQTDKKKM